MTKECKVILNNDAVTVVKFDKTEIQFPSVHKDVKSVFVKVDNGIYSIVEKMENESKDDSMQNQKKPKAYKKTSIVTLEDSDKNTQFNKNDS